MCSRKIRHNYLHYEIRKLHNRIDETEATANELQQYSRRNCLEINGIEVKNEELTDQIVQSVAKSVGVNVQLSDISVSHRLAKQNNGDPSGIIAKFVSRRTRDQIFSNKFYLKK